MREASLLPSSLRLDLLLSVAGLSFGSSSDWLSVASQAVLLACAGQTLSSGTRTAARQRSVAARAQTISCKCSAHLPYMQMFEMCD